MKVLVTGADWKKNPLVKVGASVHTLKDYVDGLIDNGDEVLVNSDTWAGSIVRNLLADCCYCNVTVYEPEPEGAGYAQDYSGSSDCASGDGERRKLDWTIRTIARDTGRPQSDTELKRKLDSVIQAIARKAEESWPDAERDESDGEKPKGIGDQILMRLDDGATLSIQSVPVLAADSCVNPVVRAMALDADKGIVFWDGEDWDGFACILLLVALGKHVDVVPGPTISHLEPLCGEDDSEGDMRFEELRGAVLSANPEHRTNGQGLPAAVQKEVVKAFVPSRDMRSSLASCQLKKTDVAALVIGACSSLQAKLDMCKRLSRYDDVFNECVDEAERAMCEAGGGRAWQALEPEDIAKRIVAVCKEVLASSFTAHAKVIGHAVDELQRSEKEHFSLARVHCGGPCGDDYDEEDASSFATADAALRILNKAEDRLESGAASSDANALSWMVLKKLRWRLRDDEALVWDNPYTYYLVKDGVWQVAFFDENRYDRFIDCWRAPDEGRWWPFIRRSYGCDFAVNLDADVPIPFNVGDLVTLDCRPFVQLAHCLVLASGRERQAGRSVALVRQRRSTLQPDKGLWEVREFNRDGSIRFNRAGYSTLYKAEVCAADELSDCESVLGEAQHWLQRSERRARRLVRELSRHEGGVTDDELRALIVGADEPDE